MSYDLRLGVKIEGLNQIVQIRTPEYDNPTYNLGQMFRACTTWPFVQGDYYKCSDVIEKIENGIRELRTRPEAYRQYEPSNGWGTLEGAIRVLESLRECIYDTAEEVPLEYLYVAW